MIRPESTMFDQRIMRKLIEDDPLMQRYRTFFALFAWNVVSGVGVISSLSLIQKPIRMATQLLTEKKNIRWAKDYEI